MNFKIETSELQKAFKILNVAVKLNALDATGRVLVEAGEEGVSFSANNGAVAASFLATKVEVLKPGKQSFEYVKAKSFFSAVKPWSDNCGVDRVEFLSNENTTTISFKNVFESGRASKNSLKLQNYNAALISSPQQLKNPSFMFNSDLFRAAVAKTIYAINQTLPQSNSALLGLNMAFNKDTIIFTGADGKVLSEYEVSNPSACTNESIILSYDFVNALRRLLPEDVQMVWEILPSKILIGFEEVVVTGRRIVGTTYPEYREVFNAPAKTVNVGKISLISSLQALSDVLDSDDNFRLTVEIKNKLIGFLAPNAYSDLEVDFEDNIDFTTDLNGRLLIQTVEAIKDDNIAVKFSDKKPLILDSSSYGNQKALVMLLKRR